MGTTHNHSDPIRLEAIAQFRDLLAEAGAAGEPEPTAMTLATADAAGRVSARIVLLKAVDERGFVFYTNYESAKAGELAAHPQTALCFLWKTLRHVVQVRVEGEVEKAGAGEADAYFASRPRESRIGAWASKQSQTLPDRAELDARIAETEQRYAGAEVPRPPFWGGYRLVPDMLEFWFGQRARLHDRVRYARGERGWQKCLLYP
ncbi:MAG: pyridoxamine 5'-phosphate oxidase [Proteobacteria bacterium]|uniref:pyridoxamine 5'-phosphate oxidase n=1 Tax=Rudaea sp. TaxID=2136325 RepID=UPI001E1A768B|nr:pyridoxamine 5'-phosphate oxidase [Pseudomonadota bacterium]MBS0566667.1 pyridoxamine 5'-phosphate oxidase [Pseudomonadota bacterium]